MATPSLAMIPSAIADSKVYSVLPNNGDGDFTFNRDSSATRVGQDGLIQTVGFFGNELVTNGTFDTNLNNWNVTLAGQTVEWDNGRVKYITDGALAFLEQTITTVIGRVYRATVDINVTSGEFVLNVGGQDIEGDGVQTLEMLFTATSTTTLFQLKRKPGAAASGYFDNATFKEVTGDQPRLNYDISNGQVQSCPSLLLEPASTNLINFSEPTSSETTATGITYESYIWAVGHFTNCIKFGDNSQTRYRYFTGTIANSTAYVISAFVIMDDLSEPTLGTNSATGDFILRVGGTSASTGNLPNVNMGNSIYRVSSVITSGAGGGSTGLLKYTTQSNIGFRIVGFQVEALTYATSYIPTNGSSQTRAAETCNNVGTASTFNSTEGVLYAEVALNGLAPNSYIQISDNSYNNRVAFINNNSATAWRTFYRVGGASQIDSTASGLDVFVMNKIALSWKVNQFKFYVNGTKIVEDTSGSVNPANTFTRIDFSDIGNTNKFYGKVKDLRVYNEALTDAQLQTLTTL